MTIGPARGARLLLPVACALAAAALTLVWWAVAGDGSAPARARSTRAAAAGSATEAAALPAAPGAPASPARSLAAGAVVPREGPPPPPAGTTVVVIDERDRPVAGATVRALPPSSLAGSEWVTDETGRAAMGVLDPDETLRLEAEHAGHVHVTKLKQPGETVFLRLRRALPLEGRVHDAGTGEPIADARVRLQHGWCDACAPEDVFSDGTGTYRFAAVPADTALLLQVRAEGWVESGSRLRTGPDDERAVHDVELRRGLPVVLKVVDALTGAPIEGSQVEGVRKGRLTLRTDALGRVESDQLAELGADRARLVVRTPGYCSLKLRPTTRELLGRAEWELPLVKGARLEVRVVDAAGAPAELAILSFDDPGLDARSAPAPLPELLAHLPRWTLESTATVAGAPPERLTNYTVEGFVPGAELTLTASTFEGARWSTTVTLPGPGETTRVVLRVPSAAVVTGPATIRGRLTLAGEPEQGRVVWRGATRSGDGRSGKDGRFVLEGVEPGPVTLTAQSDRVLARSTCALDGLAPLELFVRAGEELEQNLDLELALAPIAGRVTEADGRPAAGVEVEVRDPDRCWRERLETDDEGRFEAAVPAGLPSYEVRVTRAPEELRRDGVAPGSAGVDFTLSPLGRLRFRVTDADDGSPVPRGVIEWRRPGGRHEELVDFGRLVPDGGGWYEVPCVAGDLDLTASTARDRHVPRMLRRVRVPVGGTAEVEFELRPGLTRRLVLEPGSIEPPEGFAAALVPESLADRVHYALDPRPRWVGLAKRGPSAELRFKSGGTARARGLRPGPYRLLVWPPGLRAVPERLRLDADEPEATVRLRLGWR